MTDGIVQLEGEQFSDASLLRARLAEINSRIPTPVIDLKFEYVGCHTQGIGRGRKAIDGRRVS